MNSKVPYPLKRIQHFIKQIPDYRKLNFSLDSVFFSKIYIFKSLILDIFPHSIPFKLMFMTLIYRWEFILLSRKSKKTFRILGGFA